MKYYMAIDIGGTKIKYCILNEAGEVNEILDVDTPRSATGEEVIVFLKELIEGLWHERIAGIGISTLGIVDEEQGIVVGACDNFPGLLKVRLKQELSLYFQRPVAVMNDVNAAALGEAFFGAGKALNCFYCLTLGTGIGGALVVNKKVYLGAHGMAGEAGYLWNGRQQSYEELASVKAFLEAVWERDKPISGVEIFDSIENGEIMYRTQFQQWVDHVAAGVKDIIYIIDPGVFIIGGGVSERGRFLTDYIQKSLDDQLMPDFKSKSKVIPAAHFNTANLLGAITALLGDCK